MKIVFYRTLLKRAKNITPSEKIIYSFLVAKSIEQVDEIFEADGVSIRLDDLALYLEVSNRHCDICEISHSKLAKELHMTRKTIIEGMKHLQELGYVGEDWIFISMELIEHGYFILERAETLTGDLLIFYSYLRDKSAKYGYQIDTYKDKLGEKFGKSKIAITKLLNRLYEENLAKRLKNGKLQIY